MKKQKMSTIDKVLLGLVGFLLGFIIAMIVIFCIYQATPDVLIQCVLTAAGSETVITFAIWYIKKKGTTKNGTEEKTDKS